MCSVITGLVLFFEQTSYTVSESAGSLEVCLFQDVEEGGSSVATGVQVEVNLAETSETSLGTILHEMCGATLATLYT